MPSATSPANLPVVVVINESGLVVANSIRQHMDVEITVPERLATTGLLSYDGSSAEVIKKLFLAKRPLILIMASGIAVRALSGLPESKYSDPPVVVVDTSGDHVISLLSGHEGGANVLALDVANCIDATPVITTGTEAAKRFCLGVGCRKGVTADDVSKAIMEFLNESGHNPKDIRWAATVEDKRHETGLLAALCDLDIPLRIFSRERIATVTGLFAESAASRHLGIAAVADPCAFLAADKGRLIIPKRVISPVTLAMAEMI